MSLQQKEIQRNRRVEGAADMAVFLVKSCDKSVVFFSGSQEKARDTRFSWFLHYLYLYIYLKLKTVILFLLSLTLSPVRPSLTHLRSLGPSWRHLSFSTFLIWVRRRKIFVGVAPLMSMYGCLRLFRPRHVSMCVACFLSSLNSQQVHNSHIFKLSQTPINFSYKINPLLH